MMAAVSAHAGMTHVVAQYRGGEDFVAVVEIW